MKHQFIVEQLVRRRNSDGTRDKGIIRSIVRDCITGEGIARVQFLGSIFLDRVDLKDLEVF